jgi:hypothetical protein
MSARSSAPHQLGRRLSPKSSFSGIDSGMKSHRARIILILIGIATYSFVVFSVLGSAKGEGARIIALLLATVGISGATIAILRSSTEQSKAFNSLEARLTRSERTANFVFVCAILVFVSTWSVGMYVSFRGSSSPVPSIGAVYPLNLNGGMIYVRLWQYYLCSTSARTIGIGLMALAIYFRRQLVQLRK